MTEISDKFEIADEPTYIEAGGPTFSEIAHEEFWFVAKAFFAPIYGALLVLRQLLQATRKVDNPSSAQDQDPWYFPAE